MNSQLKNINITLKAITEDIIKNKDKLKSLLKENQDIKIKSIFQTFCQGKTEMESKSFSKFCKTFKLIDKKFGINDIDIVFAKVKKGKAKTITFSEFQNALSEIAKRKGTTKEFIEYLIKSMDKQG